MFLTKNILQTWASGAHALNTLFRPAGMTHKRLQIASISSLQAQMDHSNKALVIQEESSITSTGQDHHQLKFPYVWLRDNCQCKDCFHPVSKARLFLTRHLDPNIVPKKTEVTNNGNIYVIWPDDHKSVFDYDWLKKRKFTRDDIHKRLSYMSRPTRVWNADLQNKIPKFDYNEIISSNKTLWQWLVDMEEIGLTLITGCPVSKGIPKKIGNRVAFLKTTNYGQTFTVRSKMQPSNIAYTSATLGLHTDLPQYHYTPGIQMLHCISQVPTEGGDNIFSDAFYTVEILRRDYPEYFKMLTTVEIDFHDIGTDAYKFHMMMRVPTIELDGSGKPTKINYNSQVRDSILNVPFENVQPLYEAICKMEEILNDKRSFVNFKLKEGEMVCFHNYRVLHGRNGYRVLESGDRHLEGGYIDWDEMKSRRRVLEEELQQEK